MREPQRVAGLDAAGDADGLGRDRVGEVVPRLEGMEPRRLVAEPEVPRRDVAGRALQEQAVRDAELRAEPAPERAGVVGVPQARLTADRHRVAGEAHGDGDGLAVAVLDPEHPDRVVDRLRPVDAVDADAVDPAGAEADPRRLQAPVGAVDSAGDPARHRKGVLVECVAGEGLLADPGRCSGARHDRARR